MSEYMEIEVEETDEFDVIEFTTNLTLTLDEQETYATVAEMEEGSALAQFLSTIPGIEQLVIEAKGMLVTRDPEVEWHSLIEDISAAVKEFFL